MAAVAESKKQVVSEFTQLIRDYPIIGAVNVNNLPTPQLQKMRENLRGKVVIKMTKRRLMKYALEAVKDEKKDIQQLETHLKGMPAMLFTKENPFKLYQILKENKSKAPAKAGQTAPCDIVIPAGATPFAPGPIIGELGMLGLKTGIEGGKVAIKEDKIVAKEGDVISDKIASVLSRLNIMPMEIGLDLTATYEDGTIFTKSVLNVDKKEYENKLVQAFQESLNLAVESGFPTKESTELMISKAFNDAKSLALSQNIVSKDTIEEILRKAEGQMQSLKQETKQ